MPMITKDIFDKIVRHEGGDFAKILRMANNYRTGDGGIVQNEERAFEIFSELTHYEGVPEEVRSKACYNLGLCYHRGIGTKQDSSLAIMAFLEAGVEGLKVLELVNKNKIAVEPDSSVLNAAQILEVIEGMEDGKRISNPNSHLIGDLVRVSQELLKPLEIALIYEKISKIVGEKSKACKIVGDCLAEKFGYDRFEGYIANKTKVALDDHVNLQDSFRFSKEQNEVDALSADHSPLLKSGRIYKTVTLQEMNEAVEVPLAPPSPITTGARGEKMTRGYALSSSL